MTSTNDKRIAKNTFYLYGRMLLSIIIQLYSSRVILETLGVENYGVYNVVGGIIIIISSINGSMAGATQRFLNYEMGQNNDAGLQATFRGALKIHMYIASIMFLLGETIGLWFVNTQLVIDVSRIYAANWVYQLSLIGAIFSIIQVPYTATVIAHEQMGIFAILSLSKSILTLIVAIALTFFGRFDTLIVYAWLILAVSIIIFLGYFLYSKKNFKETAFDKNIKGKSIKELLTFSGADMFGNICYTTNLQGVTVILNNYGSAILSAAAGINLIVKGTVSQFGIAIVSAFRPQIVKRYAAEQYDYMFILMTNCSKYAMLLMSLIAIPAILNMELILEIWLKDVPPYSTIFCQLTLMASVGEMVRSSLNSGIHASGKIFGFSLITGGLYLVELLAMYIFLYITNLPWVVFAVHLIFLGIIITATAFILRRLIPQFCITQFLNKGVILPAIIILTSAFITYLISESFDNGLLKFIISTCISTLVLAILTFFGGVDREVRAEILSKFYNKSDVRKN